jgi:hypothetical protein
LEDCQFHDNEEEEMAVHKHLGMHQPYFYPDRIFNLVPRWENASMFMRIMSRKNDTSVPFMSYI